MNRPRYMIMALFWVALGAACGCGTANCGERVIQIVARDMHVELLSLSGPGCENARIRSSGAGRTDDGFRPYCQYYYIFPGAPGECTVHIELENGMAVDKTVSFVYQSGEDCVGYYPRGYRTTWLLSDLFSDAGAG